MMKHLVFKRVTTESEAEVLRTVRNACRDFMTRNTEEISPEQQREWFKKNFKKYELYLAYVVESGVIILEAGYGLIHLNENEYLLSGGLLPLYRDKGLGSNLFKFLIDNCNKQLPIRLEVLKTNTRAFKTYERLNFVVTGETDKIYLMEYNYDSVI